MLTWQVLLLAQPLDRAYLITIWLTAARVREVNNLTWEDVDFEKMTIRLWTRKKKGGNKTPRLVGMVDKVNESLQYVWKHREKNSPYVFTNPVMVERYPGTPAKWKYDYRDKFFDTLCRKAGIPEMGYHALRHYAASALADANVPITAIQGILGHERATTTDNYLQTLGQSVANGMEKIDA
jgi:integrase